MKNTHYSYLIDPFTAGRRKMKNFIYIIIRICHDTVFLIKCGQQGMEHCRFTVYAKFVKRFNFSFYILTQIHLLETFKGASFLSAVSLMGEIGDFSAFSKPKQLFAYFGLDPK